MADINSLTGFLGDVANAIREKDGIVGNIYPKDYDNRIRNISTGSSMINGLYSFSFRQGTKDSYDEEIAQMNTSSVQNLRQSFYGCKNLKNISEFDMSNVKGMNNIFYGCTNLTNNSLCNICNMLPLYNNITDSTKNSKLTYLGLLQNQIDNIPESLYEMIQNKGWSIGEMLEYILTYMNNNISNINTIQYKSDTNNGRLLRNYLQTNIRPFKITNLSINGIENIQDCSELFYDFQNLFSIEQNTINNINSSANILGIFFNCKNLTGEIPNLDFQNKIQITELSYHWMSSNMPFWACRNLTGEIPNYIFNNNTTSLRGLFYDCRNLTGEIPNWNLKNIRYLDWLFDGCSNLTGNIPNWNTFKVESMIRVFPGTKLTGNIPNWNLSNIKNYVLCIDNYQGNSSLPNWDLSNCILLGRIASKNITGSIPNWNLSNLKELMSDTFDTCSNLTGSIPNWNFNNLENITNQILYFGVSAGLFMNCFKLTGSIPNWNFSNLKRANFDSMFWNCSNLTGSIPNWNLSNCNNIRCSKMFYNCQNLIGNIPNLKYNTNTLYDMFELCTNLTGSIPNFDTSNIIYMESMFYGCKNLTGSIPNFNLSNIKNMQYLFAGCSNLTGNIPNWNLSNIKNLTGVFQNCHRLTGQLPNWDFSNTTDVMGLFENCKNLTGEIPNWNLSNIINFCNTSMYSLPIRGGVGLGIISGCEKLTGGIPAWNLNKCESVLTEAFANCSNINDFSSTFIINTLAVSKGYRNIFYNDYNLSKNAMTNIMLVFGKIHPNNAGTDFYKYIGLNNATFLKNTVSTSVMSQWGQGEWKNAWPEMQNIASNIITGTYTG